MNRSRSIVSTMAFWFQNGRFRRRSKCLLQLCSARLLAEITLARPETHEILALAHPPQRTGLQVRGIGPAFGVAVSGVGCRNMAALAAPNPDNSGLGGPAPPEEPRQPGAVRRILTLVLVRSWHPMRHGADECEQNWIFCAPCVRSIGAIAAEDRIGVRRPVISGEDAACLTATIDALSKRSRVVMRVTS